MKSSTLFCGLIAMLVCLPGIERTPVSAEPPAATIALESLSPPAGAKIKARTILRAEIRYHIPGFDPKTGPYVIAPFFDHVSGTKTFNAIERFLDAKHLKTASGVVKLTYPISWEWVSGDLTKPVRVVFRILKVTNEGGGRHSGMPLIDTEVISYEAE
jgi:hypothetical protein